MSREIAFRVWEEREKAYNTWTFILDTLGNLFRNVYGALIGCNKKDYIVEQYTGLKDRNGKEIYEGDIIEVFSTDEYLARFEGVYRVYFDNMWLSYMMYKVKSNYSSVTEHFEPEMSVNIEVIGNIHENPELLEN